MKILDLIDPERSDIRYKRMSFPDGQPHFELLVPSEIANEAIQVVCRIKSASDIADVALAIDAIRGCIRGMDDIIVKAIGLNVAFMLGARMDRRIAPNQPATLEVLGRMLTASIDGADYVRVLDPHSQETLKVFWREGFNASAIYPDRLVVLALAHFGTHVGEPTIVIPDEGAVDRTGGIIARMALTNPVARCVKKRDSATGKLSGFALVDGEVQGRDCLIVDDLCDGGGTFAGIAEVLRAAGARSVALCVTHGIFSKGYAINGIDCTYTTDSFAALTPSFGYRLERHELGFMSLRRPDSTPILNVLTDFLRDHVRGEVAHG